MLPAQFLLHSNVASRALDPTQEKSQSSFEALIAFPLLLSSKSVSFGFSSEKVGTEKVFRERGERERGERI